MKYADWLKENIDELYEAYFDSSFSGGFTSFTNEQFEVYKASEEI